MSTIGDAIGTTIYQQQGALGSAFALAHPAGHKPSPTTADYAALWLQQMQVLGDAIVDATAEAVGMLPPTGTGWLHVTGGVADAAASTPTYTQVGADAAGAAAAITLAGLGGVPLSDSRLSDDRTASGLRTATTIVAMSAATAPTPGQVLTATGTTAATWQTPTGGSGNISKTTIMYWG